MTFAKEPTMAPSKEETMALVKEQTKLLFLDLDGTLLNSEKQVSEGNRAALEEARQAGHKIILCSGRPLSAMKKIIKSLSLDKEGCYAICYNGALIYDTFQQKALFSSPLSAEEVEFIWGEADKIGLYAQTYDSSFLLTRKDCKEFRTYSGITGMEPHFIPTLPKDLPELPFKVLCIDLEDHDRLEQFRQHITKECSGKYNLTGFFSCNEFVEFVRGGISKGSAIEWMAEALGVPMENTIGVGDSDNDLPMLQTAYISVAMANSADAIKAAAKYVTTLDNDHDGVAEVIHRFVLAD